MGVSLSKKGSFVDIDKQISSDLLQLKHWSLVQIRKTYECYRRRFNSMTLDTLMFSKIVPFSRKISMAIFIKYTEQIQQKTTRIKGINIFQFISLLVLLSYGDCLCKLQFLLIIFNFSHEQNRLFESTFVIFQATVSAFCRVTKQELPSYKDIRYYFEKCLLKSNLRGDSDINLKKLQILIQANEDIQNVFQRFQPELIFQQIHTLFKRFPIYLQSEIEQIKLSIKELYSQKYLITQKHKRSLSHNILNPLNKQFTISKKSSFSGLKNQEIRSTSRLPSVPNKHKKINYNNIPRLIFIGGTSISKDDIFNLLNYFYKLSGGQQIIMFEDFLQSFQEISFMKKMTSMTFKYLDTKQKGKITFQNLLQRLFPSLAKQDMKLVKIWIHQYKTIYEITYNNGLKQQTLQSIHLPSTSLIKLKQVFTTLDHGKKGYLTIQDLKKSFKIGYNQKDLQQTFKKLDPEGTKQLNIRQLARLLLPGNYSIEGLQQLL